MDLIQKELLEEIADLHGVPAGAYNIRANGAAAARNTTANIDIVSKEKYKSIKNKNFADNLINDRKILEITKDCQEIYNKKIEFISSDIMARTRAISFDIPTSDVLGDKKNILGGCLASW